MILDWVLQAPALLVSVVVVFGPGLLVLWALGIRGMALWALAPAAGTAVLTGAALVLGALGVGWRPLAATAALLVLATLIWAARRLSGLSPTPEPGDRDPLRTALAVGLVIGVVFVAVRLILYIGDPAAVSQTNDGAFHLSALRFAVETGAASPMEITQVIGARSFYPSAWHVLASLVAQLSGAALEVVANSVSLVIGALVWPLGIAFLTRAAAGSAAAAGAAAVSGFVPAFPLLLVQWGVLYPQLLAGALLPAVIAAAVSVPALVAERGRRPAALLRAALVVGGGVIAIGFAQPSVILAWAVGVLAWGGWEIARAWRRWSSRARGTAVVGAASSLVVIAAVWLYFGRSVSVTWPPTTGKATAVIEVIANAHLGYPAAIGVSILMVVGLVVAILRASLRWLATMWVVYAALYVLAAAIGMPMVRGLLVGPWYEDPYRLAALTPVAVIPLAGVGLAWILARIARVLKPAHADGAVPSGVLMSALAVIAVVGVLAVVVAPQIARRDVFAHRIDPNLYAVTDSSFLSTDELALLRRLDRAIPEDAIVIANPSTAASFGYAISGRNVIPRTWAPPSGRDYAILWESLRDVDADPEVCPALDAFGATHVLDFGPGEAYPGRWVMPGFTGIAGQPGFELIDSEGQATLWRITACG